MSTDSVAIMPGSSSLMDVMPIMSVEQAVERFDQISLFVQRIMKEGEDFGFPAEMQEANKGKKPPLLKPGAEKLCVFFGLASSYELVGCDEDWIGTLHAGEPFFSYRYRCTLLRQGMIITSAEGSCNSFEVKYRYRGGQRVCPECGKETIIKGRPEYEKEERYKGGFMCFGKKGGCGAKFTKDDPAIIGQETGRVNNPDVADLVNTMQKMAMKRAHVNATLNATAASRFFTQDLEDNAVVPEQPKTVAAQAAAKIAQVDPAVSDLCTEIASLCEQLPPDNAKRKQAMAYIGKPTNRTASGAVEMLAALRDKVQSAVNELEIVQ